MARKSSKKDQAVTVAEAKAKIAEAKGRQAGKNNGKGKDVAPVVVAQAPAPAKVEQAKIACPCGCGTVRAGKGIFGTGHDGRLVGWILAVESGEDKRINKIPADRLDIAKDAHGRWVTAGRPGEQHHPKIKALFA